MIRSDVRRISLVAASLAILLGVAPGLAHADIDDTVGVNIQSGDNDADADQDGDSDVGAAITGQSIDVDAGGDAAVSATNRGSHNDADTGDAEGSNNLSGFAGHASAGDDVSVSDIDDSVGVNVHDGDNEFEYDQSVDANVGDGIAGQVLSVTAGGNASVVARNAPDHVDVDGGDAEADNDASTFVGLARAGDDVSVEDITGSVGVNLQDGENELDGDQSADASSGDAVVGQDLSVHAGGNASLAATNEPEHSDADSGDADADNDASAFVGHAFASGGDVAVTDIVDSVGVNLHDGDNEGEVDQDADADTGEALTGQKASVRAGGSASVNVEERGEHNDASSGDADTSNDIDLFVGLAPPGDTLIGP